MGLDVLKLNKLVADHYLDVLLRHKSDEAGKARYYLYKRDIHSDDAESWGIGFAPPGWNDTSDFLLRRGYSKNEIMQAGVICKSKFGSFDRFRNRIMFPIKNEKKEVVGFTGRAMAEYENDIKVAKYLNSSDSDVFDKGASIFGIDKAVKSIAKKDCFIVMEGQFDVVTAHKHGITNAVACSGTALTIDHLKKMREFTNHIIVCFDNDDAGKKATLKAIYTGRELNMNIEVITLATKGDPDEILRKDPYGLAVVYANPGDEYVISEFMDKQDSFILLNYLMTLKNKDQDIFLSKVERKIL